MDKNNKILGLGLLAAAGLCFLITVAGMGAGGSHRWTEPLQQLGWILFVPGFLLPYLRTGREVIRPSFASLAWLSGIIAVALFMASLLMNAASEELKQWFKSFEVLGSIAMLTSIMTAIWSVGGWGSGSTVPE